jgi:cyclase
MTRYQWLPLLLLSAIASPALGQTRSATPPVTPDRADTVGDIQILKVRDGVHLLVGSGGSNTVVQTGDEGVLVVDTMSAEAATQLVAAIRRLSDRPILQIVNTHFDADHIGGNEAVRKAGAYFSTANTRDEGGAAILAFEETLHRMSVDGSPFAKSAWPTDTFFVRQKDLFMNGEPVQVLHQPAAHSDSDVLVHFRRHDVLVAGDVFTPDRFPVLDQGGSINGLIAGLNRILEIAVPEFNEEGGTVIVPGHGRLCDESDVSDYRDMVTIVRDRVKDMIARKATLEQVKAAKPTLDYDGVYGRPEYTGDMFVEAVYKSIAPAPAAATSERGRR